MTFPLSHSSSVADQSLEFNQFSKFGFPSIPLYWRAFLSQIAQQLSHLWKTPLAKIHFSFVSIILLYFAIIH